MLAGTERNRVPEAGVHASVTGAVKKQPAEGRKKLMKRALVISGVIAAMTVAAGLPAQAKGENGTVTISGGGGGGAPGSGGGSTFTLEQGAASEYLHLAALESNAMGSTPGGALGPRFRVQATFDCGGGRSASFHQVLYPFAADGMVVFTPQGQSFCGYELKDGWQSVSSSLRDTLVAQGLSDRAPVASPATGTAASAAETGAVADRAEARTTTARSGPEVNLPLVIGATILALLLLGIPFLIRKGRVVA
jgi:hypothetical protein